MHRIEARTGGIQGVMLKGVGTEAGAYCKEAQGDGADKFQQRD
jgi:hypothetical protein